MKCLIYICSKYDQKQGRDTAWMRLIFTVNKESLGRTFIALHDSRWEMFMLIQQEEISVETRYNEFTPKPDRKQLRFNLKGRM